MKTLKYITLLVVIFLSSCEKKDVDFCDTNKPLKDIPWLEEFQSAAKTNSNNVTVIYKVIHNGIEGFLVTPYSTLPDAMTTFRNCSGEILCEIGGIANLNTCPDFWDNVSYKELLWSNE